MLPGADADLSARVVARLHERLDQFPLQFGNERVAPGVSVGVHATLMPHVVSSAQLVDEADAAMFIDKARRRG